MREKRVLKVGSSLLSTLVIVFVLYASVATAHQGIAAKISKLPSASGVASSIGTVKSAINAQALEMASSAAKVCCMACIKLCSSICAGHPELVEGCLEKVSKYLVTSQEYCMNEQFSAHQARSSAGFPVQ